MYDFVITIAAAGSMGVSIFLIFKIYKLLKIELAKESPEPSHIRLIKTFMVFAIAMTVLSIVIEFSTSYLENNSVLSKVKELKGKRLYSTDEFSNPHEVSLIYNKDTFVISEKYPNDAFSEVKLELKTGNAGKILVSKKNAQEVVTFGHITESQISESAQALPEFKNKNFIKSKELLSLGIFYWHNNPIEEARVSENRPLAIQYLVDLLLKKDLGIQSEKEIAVKLLTQGELMNRLNDQQFEVLIAALESGVRATPYDKWDLAQVYKSRSFRNWNKNISFDEQKYKDYLSEYVKYYDKNDWANMSNLNPLVHIWYKESKDKLTE